MPGTKQTDFAQSGSSETLLRQEGQRGLPRANAFSDFLSGALATQALRDGPIGPARFPAGQTDCADTPLRCRVAIIGGGFTGASLARQLVQRGAVDGQVVVFEPRAALGGGLAYDTENQALRLNVAAARMKALPDDPDAFLAWLEREGRLTDDPNGHAGDGAFYARRADFGRFMAEQLDPLVERGDIHHLRERAESAIRTGDGWYVTGGKGSAVLADLLVIATTHPTVKPPQPLARVLAGHPRLITDLDSLPQRPGPRDRVLVVGCGLTALDVVTSLRQAGHEGEILMLSRSGQRPQCQATGVFSPFGRFTDPACRTALGLLKAVRNALHEAKAQGLPWQAVFDALRQQGQAIWQGLDGVEQKRFQRHLRRRFETHRFRMPPTIAAMVREDEERGRIRHLSGKICRVDRHGSGLEVDLVLKPHGMVERHRLQWIMVATGPDYPTLIRQQTYLLDLAQAGLIRPDALRMGLDTTASNQAIAQDGQPLPTLLVAGPLTRARFGEITGVPEIAAQAERLARQIAEAFDLCPQMNHLPA